jgi:glycosyltransferase involved in cell wall biosynthesis
VLTQGTPCFSIIVPVRNGEKYLRACLDSVRRQDVASDRWECICVDDGSTDSSSKILEAFAAEDGRFLFVENRDPGVGGARNGGLARARGRWITFLDADDLLDPSFLSCLEYLASSSAAEISGCCHGNFYGDGDPPPAPQRIGERISIKVFSPPLHALLGQRGYSFAGNGLRNHFAWGRLYDREFLGKNGLAFSSIAMGEDTLFTAQAFHLATKFALTDRVLCWHRHHPQCTMRSYHCAKYRECCVAVAVAAERWFRDRPNDLSQVARRLVRRHIGKIIYEGCLRGRHGRGFWGCRRENRRRLLELCKSGLFAPSALQLRHRVRSEIFLRLGF